MHLEVYSIHTIRFIFSCVAVFLFFVIPFHSRSLSLSLSRLHVVCSACFFRFIHCKYLPMLLAWHTKEKKDNKQAIVISISVWHECVCAHSVRRGTWSQSQSYHVILFLCRYFFLSHYRSMFKICVKFFFLVVFCTAFLWQQREKLLEKNIHIFFSLFNCLCVFACIRERMKRKT